MLTDFSEDDAPVESMKRIKGKRMLPKESREFDRRYHRNLKIQRRVERRQQYRDQLGPKKRAKVWARYGDQCYLCGKKGADTIDHIIPINKGGSHEFKNLRPAHSSCNKEKGDKIVVLPEELEAVGW